MATDYKSPQFIINNPVEQLLEKKTQDGLSWECKFHTDYSINGPDDWRLSRFGYLSWKFEYNDADLEGNITVSSKSDWRVESKDYEIKLLKSGEWITKRLGTWEEMKAKTSDERRLNYKFYFETFFEPSSPHACYDMENPTAEDFDLNKDTLLVFGEGHVQVNRMFLSMHSEFFDKMFNSSFKEKSQNKIEIKHVKLDDFKRLLKCIDLKEVCELEDGYEVLLKLADRFIMPVVTKNIVHFLMFHAKLGFGSVLKTIDKYNQEKQVDFYISIIDKAEVIRVIQASSDYQELSVETKQKLSNKAGTLL